MSDQEQLEIENLPTIGYWSALGGVEVKRIHTVFEEYVWCIAHAWSGKRTAHRLRIQYTHAKNSRAYIKLEGHKLYMDECLRTSH